MGTATTVPMIPGVLNTTLAPTAIPEGSARDLLNCDTGYGDWRLDLRHRRFCAPPVLVSTPTTYVFDSFTGLAYTTLESHVGETNAVWRRPFVDAYPNQILLSPAGRAFRSAWNPNAAPNANNTNGSEHFTTSMIPVADYVVRAPLSDLGGYAGSGPTWDQPGGGGPPGTTTLNGRVINASGLDNNPARSTTVGFVGNTAWLLARVQNDFSGYGAFLNKDASTWNIVRFAPVLGGSLTYTFLDSKPAAATSGVMELSVFGSEISLWVDGVQVCSATDSSVTGAGFVGIRLDGGSSPIHGLQFDSFTVDNDFPFTLPDPIPSGIGYAEGAGGEEFAVVAAPGAFSAPGAAVETAYGAEFGGDLAPATLVPGDWVVWTFGGKVFYTSPEGGVWYRDIGGATLQPLFLDTESPGSSGDASFVASQEFIHAEIFDPSVDTIAMSNPSGTVSPDANHGFIASGDGLGRIHAFASGDWFQAVVTKGVPINASGADSLGIVLTDKSGTGDGYRSGAANNQAILANSSGTATATLPIQVGGRLDARGGSYFGWIDLSGVPDSIKGDVKTLTIRVGIRQGGTDTKFRFETIAFGGIRYRDTAWGKTATTLNTAPTTYAYDISEGAVTSQGRKLVVSPAALLGARIGDSQPYMGASVTVTVPSGDAPFTGAATIRLYRLVAGTYRRIATGPNTGDLIFPDILQDSQIAADTTTYPISTLSFDAPISGFSGQVKGIVCGCAYKGSNLYAGLDGNVYGSRTGYYDDVLWDNVTRTNDQGSDDLSPPRTAVIADDLKSPALCMVPGESLYLLTSREVYAMIPGETFATASFPRKCDGARGVLGVRAATVDGDGCLYGARDGLWFVRKSTFDSSQPDELTEVTKYNRGAWAWLLGTTPSKTVVRKHLGETWCFNGVRYLHLTRQGRTIKGQWADGRSVVDAAGDPTRGLVLQLSDGSLALIGAYASDGGTDLGGTNGAAPNWTYSTGIRAEANAAARAVILAQIGEGGAVSVAVETDREDSPATVEVDGAGLRLVSRPIDRASGGGDLLSLTVAGGATDRLLSVGIELVPRESHRQLDRTIP